MRGFKEYNCLIRLADPFARARRGLAFLMKKLYIGIFFEVNDIFSIFFDLFLCLCLYLAVETAI